MIQIVIALSRHFESKMDAIRNGQIIDLIGSGCGECFHECDDALTMIITILKQTRYICKM